MGWGSLPFKMVHTILALGFFVLAGWAHLTASMGDGGPLSGGDGEGRQTVTDP